MEPAFISGLEISKDDPTLEEIYKAMWRASDDFHVHRLTGKYSPSGRLYHLHYGPSLNWPSIRL